MIKKFFMCFLALLGSRIYICIVVQTVPYLRHIYNTMIVQGAHKMR